MQGALLSTKTPPDTGWKRLHGSKDVEEDS